jgi:predicted lysophospholipase L1 biosynthesis ABC-type transport system permease subunit
MKIHLVKGRDFLPSDTAPGVAIVNETFVKQFLGAGWPVGQSIAKGNDAFRVVGVVRDAPYKDIHEPILPAVYVPLHSLDAKGATRPVPEATFIVRTSAQNPLALAPTLRLEVPRARSEFRVSNVRTQQQLVLAQTVRERLLAMLGLFFAGVALLLAGMGLYGVLDYFVLQRRREIGIRAAIGAQAGHIARHATAGVFAMVLAGGVAGVVSGMASARFIETLLYQVKATDLEVLALPPLAILITALIAAMPAVVRAVRIDPVTVLRSE